MRFVGALVCLVLLGLSFVGWLATTEPISSESRIFWRVVYSVVGVLAALGLLRCLRGSQDD